MAEIVSAGLLGDKYMSLVPGGSDKMIPPGGKIKYTQSSVSLENLIGQMMFSAPGAKKPGEGEAPPPPPDGARLRRRLAPRAPQMSAVLTSSRHAGVHDGIGTPV